MTTVSEIVDSQQLLVHNASMNIRYNTILVDMYLMQHSINRVEFCKRCRIGTGTLAKFYAQDLSLRPKQIFKIARVLNIPMGSLLKFE